MTVQLTSNEQKSRYRVCLALDNIAKTTDAILLIEELKDYAKYVKIGKELHAIACNEGVPIIKVIRDMGQGIRNIY